MWITIGTGILSFVLGHIYGTYEERMRWKKRLLIWRKNREFNNAENIRNKTVCKQWQLPPDAE
jgi:hypothetical protein